MKPLSSCYSRLLIDNHITDQKSEYMRKFSPQNYAAMVALAGVESAMVYACDHNGNCYYPTQVGHIHNGCQGRDLFGATVKLLADQQILPIAYYTVIYHNQSANDHPDWRVCDISGNEMRGRYRCSCPNNSEYVKFCCQQIDEIIKYPVGGIFIDMTFWPMVCACQSCREKYGQPIPEVIDWSNPDWVRFQRWRESCMADYAAILSKFVKTKNPELTVTHQFSPVLHGWYLGQSPGIAAASDYASGDFYGGSLQQRFGCKVFDAFTRQPPYEFMTSRCENLHDHVSTKSDAELFLHAATTLANGGAFFFIDAINPDGTLEEKFYQRLSGVVKRLNPYKDIISKYRPRLQAEVGVYFSMKSCVQEDKNGLLLSTLTDSANNMSVRQSEMLDELLGCADILNCLHIPYKIVTETCTDLTEFKVLIVNHANYMNDAEVRQIRQFVQDGGLLIATGKSSFYNEYGETDNNFQLADVFGVDYSGQDTDLVSYLVAENLVSCGGHYPLVTARSDARILGNVAVADFPVNDPVHYASIHSNPPGKITDYAGWTEHQYGQGKAIYLYSGLLKYRQNSQREFGQQLFSCLPSLFVKTAGLHPTTELTLLKGTDNTLIIAIVNYQERLPNLPLREVKIALQLPEHFVPSQVTCVSNGDKLPFNYQKQIIELELATIQDVEFLIIQ